VSAAACDEPGRCPLSSDGPERFGVDQTDTVALAAAIDQGETRHFDVIIADCSPRRAGARTKARRMQHVNEAAAPMATLE
jgi:hypothetical protein